MNLALLLFLGGAVVVTWIYVWAQQQADRDTGAPPVEDDIDEIEFDFPTASNGDAVLVSRGQGKLIYANGPAREMIGSNGEAPTLEQIAKIAEPADSFLQLFASEGQSSFQLGKRWVEASSLRVPAGKEMRTVVVLRELSSTSNNPDVLDMGMAMSLINEVGETVNAGMGVEQTLQALLSIVGRAISVDAGEICLWDDVNQALHQRGWVGDAMYLLELAESGGMYKLDEGITGWVARHHKPVLLNSKTDLSGIRPKLEDNPYHSYIATPLKLGDRFVGTLEVAHKTPDMYTQGDLALLQAISKPIAVAIYNAEIYAEQLQRIDDLASLQSAVAEQESDLSNVAAVFGALNKRVAELLEADMCGVFLYDDDRQGLVAEPPFHGLPEALVRSIFIPLPPDSPQTDIWRNQSFWISNDVEGEPLVEALGLGPIVGVAGVNNTAWMPLEVSGQRIGVMAVSNKRTRGGFTSRDIQNLTVLVAQATIVIENVRLAQREQRLDAELVGLQEITSAIGALSHEGEFFGEITERIAKLMNVAMCGVLLYDDEGACLNSRLPFYGVDDEAIIDYKIDLSPGTIMAQLWDEERSWLSNQVQSDALVFEAGLDTLAETLNIQKTLMATLVAGDRSLGVVQVSNKLDGGDFLPSDARLLMIFATQAAAIIENSRLFREAQRSAEQAQGLRRVAELAGNVLTTEETFTPVLEEIANLIDAEVVFFNVLDQQTGSLNTEPRWVYGLDLDEPISQNIYAPGFEENVPVSHESFWSNDIQNDSAVGDSYRAFADRFDLRNALVAPLTYGDKTLGEIVVANRPAQQPFSQDDLNVAMAISSQVAAALDRIVLYEATGENLSRRLDELDAVSRVSNELAGTLDLDQVLNVIREEAVKATNADDSTIALLLPSDMWKYPDLPQLDRRLGHADSMSGLAPIELDAIARGADTAHVSDYSVSELDAAPQGAGSALAVAVMYLDQVVGVLHLFSERANRFDDRASAFLLTLAVKASLAYGNSIRFQEQISNSERLRRRVEQLNRIFELGNMFQSNTETDPVAILEAIAFSVQQSVGYDTVLMTLVDEEAGVLRRVAHAGMPISVFEDTKTQTMQVDGLKELLRDDYRISESYFFPVEDVGEWYVEHISALSVAFDGNRTMHGVSAGWRDGDMFLVTLLGAAGDLIGAMSLDRPHDQRRPDRSLVEVLEIFAHQAATTIENTRLYTSSMRSAEQEARLNDVMEAVSSTLDVREIIEAVASGALKLAEFSNITVALRDIDDQGFDVLRGAVQGDGSLEIEQDRRLSLGESALGRIYDEGRDHLFSADDPDIDAYDDLKTWRDHGERHSLLLPLMTGGDRLGVIHLGTDDEDGSTLADQQPLLRRMAQLVASSIQNARLFNQAVNLQVLNKSVVESIQQGIVVLDKSQTVISANEFMTERYGWGDNFVGKPIFDVKSDLADFMRGPLMATLEQGAPQEIINQTALDAHGTPGISNYYLYPLRYGSVINGAVILVEDVSERARLEQAMEARANQLSALTEVSSRITSSLERGEVVQLALEEMGWLLPHDAMTLWRRTGSYMALEGSTGRVDDANGDDQRFRFADFPLVHQVIDTQRVGMATDTSQLPHEIPIHQLVESWLGVPLVNQGHVVGLMMLTSSKPDTYQSKSDQNIAFAFASQVAIALANADLFEQTFDRTNELGTLLEAAQATSLTTDLDSVFRTVVELMFSALDMDDCAIMIYDDVDNVLEVQLDMNRFGDADRITPQGTRYDLTKYPAKYKALRERNVIVVNASDENTFFPEEMDELVASGDKARMLVPLVVREQSIGLIQLEQTTEDEIITQQKVRLAKALGSQVAVAIENARLSAADDPRSLRSRCW